MNSVPLSVPNSDAKTSGQAVWSLVLGILSITCLWILGSIPAIILGILAIKNIDRSGGTLKGKGLGIAGIATGGAGVLLGLMPVAIVASITMPVLTTIEGEAEAARQVSTVRSLVLACKGYASDYEGKYPNDLRQLLEEGYTDSEEMLSWESRSDQSLRLPFLYRAGLTDTSPSQEPLMIGPEPIDGKRVVGFVGGSVSAITEEEFQSEHADKF